MRYSSAYGSARSRRLLKQAVRYALRRPTLTVRRDRVATHLSHFNIDADVPRGVRRCQHRSIRHARRAETRQLAAEGLADYLELSQA
jgi:hypothetical protein